jgi:HD-GYP domain-containing protein (c-di-GMP phosphodiesterase class II)
VQRLTRLLNQQKIGFVRFSPGFSAGELRQMIKVVLGKEPHPSLEQMTALIQVGSVDAPREEHVEIARFADLTVDERNRLQEQFDRVAEQQDLDIQQITSLAAGFIAAFRREANPFLALVPIRMQDEYTFTHSVNVGILNIAQGMGLGIEGQILHDLGVAGMLHDVGKIFVAREILNKPGALTEEEFAKIQQHPSRGAQYLMNQKDIPRLAIFTAFEHHMKYDLTGYPQPPAGWQLNLCSQITMISDTFDALRTRRTYKDPWDFSKASGLMLNLAGKQLNPELTLNFLRILAHNGEALESFDDGPEDQRVKEEILGCSCSLENPLCG